METGALEPIGGTILSKPYRPNFILAWVYKIFFAKIDVDPVWIRAVREASARGTVVYVMRSTSFLDFIALDFFLNKYSLPVIRFVSNLGWWILEPLGQGLRWLFKKRGPDRPLLEGAIGNGFSALLFMRRPQSPTALKRRGEKLDVDHVRMLIDLQRTQDKPILLMPQVFVWGHRPDKLYKGVVDQVFGPQEYPGRLRTMAQMLWHIGNAKLRACDPLDLKRFLEEHGDLDDDAMVNKIHWLLVTMLDRERRVVLGPMSKGPDRLKHEILRNPRIREAVAETARREKKTPAVVEKQLRRDMNRLEARLNPLALGFADTILHFVFNQIYQGIEIDLDGMQRIREQARKGPVVLLPSHKSHLDYLLISYVFYHNGLQCPLIAAGDNLAFWPAGPILRRCGAFFIRRSFKGARLYTTLVDSYVRKVLKEGYAIEFFVEGGRSRSGKLLPPKVGLLSMVAEAADAAGIEVAYVPMAIGYEKIVEQRSYAEELAGGEKKKEDAGALLTRAPRILAAQYGRAYLQVGEILRFKYGAGARSASIPPAAIGDGTESTAPAETAPTARALKRAALDRMQSRRIETQVLAQRVAYEINRVSPVTPTSLVASALLTRNPRGLARNELLARVDWLVIELQRAGARFASSLNVAYAGGLRPYHVDAIDQAINLFVEGSLLHVHGPASDAIYQAADDRRLALDFYKNNLIHFFVPRALIATALNVGGGLRAGVPRDVLRDRVEDLARLFKGEFHFRAEGDAEFDETLAVLVEAGDLEVIDSGESSLIRAPTDAAAERVNFLAGLIRNFLESYKIAARSLGVLLKGPILAKDLVKKAMGVGDRMFLTGEILQREAISKPNIENALSLFRDLGYLSGGDGGPQRVVAGYDTEVALATIEGRFAEYL